jgi:hypothetical protein
MVVAARANVEVALELLTNVSVPARFAFFPNIGGNLEAVSARLTRLFLFFEPGGHARKV